MAALNGTITVSASEYRSCTVNGEKALFHRWEDKAEVIGESLFCGGHPGGQLRNVFGIVEFEDGTVKEILPHKIQFLDSQRLFKQFDFTQKQEDA